MKIDGSLLTWKIFMICLCLLSAISMEACYFDAIAAESPEAFSAVLTTQIFVGGPVGSYFEVIGLMPEQTAYIFVMDYGEPSFCSPQLPGECSVVLWGYSLIAPGIQNQRRRNQELFNALAGLKPFQLKQKPRSSLPVNIAWFDFKINNPGNLLHSNIIVEGYDPWDRTDPTYRVFDYMRSLKRDVVFLPQEYNLRSCVAELENPTVPSPFLASPHWKKVRLAMIAYLALNQYQPARPLFERLLEKETDSELATRLKAALKLMQAQ